MVSSMNQDRTAVRQLYKLLLKRFGRQDWWPAESHFEMMAGAILVQHTAWRNVDTSLRGLKAAGLLSQGPWRRFPRKSWPASSGPVGS